MKITTTVEVSARRIADMFVSAIEGNHITMSWCDGVFLSSAWPVPQHKWWYDDPRVFEGDFRIMVMEIADHDDDDIEHTVTQVELRRGLETMASKYPKHFNAMMDENDDGITADVFLQCVALNDVVYG